MCYLHFCWELSLMKEILSYVTLSAYLSFVLLFLVAELVDLNSLVGIDHFMYAAPGCGSPVDVLWRYRNCDDAVISPLLCPRTSERRTGKGIHRNIIQRTNSGMPSKTFLVRLYWFWNVPIFSDYILTFGCRGLGIRLVATASAAIVLTMMLSQVSSQICCVLKRLLHTPTLAILSLQIAFKCWSSQTSNCGQISLFNFWVGHDNNWWPNSEH